MKEKDESLNKVILPIIRRVLPNIIALDVLGLDEKTVIKEEIEKIEAERDG